MLKESAKNITLDNQWYSSNAKNIFKITQQNTEQDA